MVGALLMTVAVVQLFFFRMPRVIRCRLRKETTVGRRFKVSLGKVVAFAPGEVTMKAPGPERGEDLAVLSFAKFARLKLVTQFGGSSAAAVISGIIGVVLLVWDS